MPTVDGGLGSRSPPESELPRMADETERILSSLDDPSSGLRFGFPEWAELEEKIESSSAIRRAKINGRESVILNVRELL
jgi:hypothetical protein